MGHDVGLYTNPAGLRHDTGPGHPERIARLENILSLLREEPYCALPLAVCEDTDTDLLLYAHPQSYIDAIADLVPERGHMDFRNEVVLSPGTWEAAVSAAGAVCRAAGDVIDGRCRRAFCAVRPPGHHALPSAPMGFCFFNNIFIAARYAQERHGISRVAIADFDVHHGNGTDAMARDAAGIFFISSHQSPLWPGSGDPAEDVSGKIMNLPLPPGAGGAAFHAAWEEKAFPALEAFAPELLLISAGFDAHRADPLAGLMLEAEDYRRVTRGLCAIADRHCGGRVVSALEGGYDLAALPACVAAHVDALRK